VVHCLLLIDGMCAAVPIKDLMVWQPWLFSTPTRDVRCLRGAGHVRGAGWAGWFSGMVGWLNFFYR
jgi:hypothetical protein